MGAGSDIEIVVKKGQSIDGTAAPASAKAGEKPLKKTDPGKPDITQEAVNTALINAGKNIIMNGIHQFGNITGDYAIINAFDVGVSLSADLATVMKGGWVGAIQVGSKYAIAFANSEIAEKRSNMAIDKARERAGYIELGGSRFTNG